MTNDQTVCVRESKPYVHKNTETIKKHQESECVLTSCANFSSYYIIRALLWQLQYGIYNIYVLNNHRYDPSNKIPDVSKEKRAGNCQLMILFELAAADELNLDIFLSLPTTLLLFSLRRLIKHSFPELSAITEPHPQDLPVQRVDSARSKVTVQWRQVITYHNTGMSGKIYQTIFLHHTAI